MNFGISVDPFYTVVDIKIVLVKLYRNKTSKLPFLHPLGPGTSAELHCPIDLADL